MYYNEKNSLPVLFCYAILALIYQLYKYIGIQYIMLYWRWGRL